MVDLILIVDPKPTMDHIPVVDPKPIVDTIQYK